MPQFYFIPKRLARRAPWLASFAQWLEALGFRFGCASGVVAGTFGDALGIFAETGDRSTWALGLEHNLSVRSQIYALYVALDDERPAADWSGLSLGLRHWF